MLSPVAAPARMNAAESRKEWRQPEIVPFCVTDGSGVTNLHRDRLVAFTN
jgi:hypothetical protein